MDEWKQTGDTEAKRNVIAQAKRNAIAQAKRNAIAQAKRNDEISQNNGMAVEDRIREERIGTDTFSWLPIFGQGRTDFAEALYTTKRSGRREGAYGQRLPDGSGFREGIYENYLLAAEHFGTDPDHCVLSAQTHRANIRRVTREDAGNGITRPSAYHDIDGLCTDVPGLVLITLHADCTPLFFADPVHRAVGIAHSGWRGTAARIGAAMIRKMQEEFGTRPEDLEVGIGPTIRACCYEIGPEVAEVFSSLFGMECCRKEEILLPGREDRSMLDLGAANKKILQDAGILPEHLQDCGICTCCHGDLFFSRRGGGAGRKGNSAGMIMIRQTSNGS